MGAYINPVGQTKEEFLNEKAKEITLNEFRSFDFRDKNALPVCLINNGPFTAAGIAYNKKEQRAFTHEDDFRPKTYYLADKEELMEVSDLKIYID